MDLRSSQSDIDSQSSPCGVKTVQSHLIATPNGNTNTTTLYPSAVTQLYQNNTSKDGYNSASCSFNKDSSYGQQHIASLLSAVGSLHLVVVELKADQDAFRNKTESIIRSLSTEAKEAEQTIALLRNKVERLESTVDLLQPSSWTAKACGNHGRSEPTNRDHTEEEKEEIDVDKRPFVRRSNPIRVDSRGKETSTTEWESESDSDHQPRRITRNETREGNSWAQSAITPQPQADPTTTSGFDVHYTVGNARSLITDATTMIHSEAGNMVETIESAEDDLVDEEQDRANHSTLRHQFMHRNSSTRCIGNHHDIAAPNPVICSDDGNPVPPQAVPAEIEIKPNTSHHDLRSEESSFGAAAARMPNRNDDSVSLISDISFYNHNHTTCRNVNVNVTAHECKETSPSEDMTRKLEDLNRAIEETRRIS